MTDTVHVAAVVGSLRDGSYTRAALRHALTAASEVNASTDLVDLRNLTLPPYNPDTDEAGDADQLRHRLDRADGILLGTPMYHGSYSAAIKTALDYCGFDEFEQTTVGLLAVAGGSFPITALEHLRSVCRALDAWVLPHQAAIPNASSKFEAGQLTDDAIAKRIDALGRQVVQYARIEPDPSSFQSEQNVGASD